MFTVGVFAVPLKVLHQNSMTGDSSSFWNWWLLGVKHLSRHTHKTRSCYLLGILFHISNEEPDMGVPLIWECPQVTCSKLNKLQILVDMSIQCVFESVFQLDVV